MEEEIKEEPSEQAKPDFQIKLDEMKVESERMEKNIAEIKELKAIETMSGNTGTPKDEEKKEETDLEYKNRVMSGKVDG